MLVPSPHRSAQGRRSSAFVEGFMLGDRREFMRQIEYAGLANILTLRLFRRRRYKEVRFWSNQEGLA